MERRDFLKIMASSGIAALFPAACRSWPGGPEALAASDAITQAALVARGEASAAELVAAAIERIRRIDPALNAVVTRTFARARARAEAARTGGPLWGVPYLLKDLNPYRGARFTRGSRMFKNDVADWQSPYTDKTEDQGLIVLGKTNTPEFGLMATTESLALGACRNPWNLAHSSGGSSGGAAAAVAARLVPAAQASDGGGSIRIPAAACGLFGLKPSRGRFPRQAQDTRPIWPLSISHPLSWSVRDSALLLALTERPDGPLPPVGFVEGPGKKRLEIVMSLQDAEGRMPDPEVAQAVRRAATLLENRGHRITPLETTPLADPSLIEHFWTVWSFFGHAAAQEATRRTGLAPARQTDLLEPWTISLALAYRALPDPDAALARALSLFGRISQRVARFFQTWDAWLSPVTAAPAPQLGAQAPVVPYQRLRARLSRYAAYTPLHNVAGTPAMSVPMGWSKPGLPIGIQIAAALGGEGRLLQLAYELEADRPWAQRLPPVHA